MRLLGALTLILCLGWCTGQADAEVLLPPGSAVFTSLTGGSYSAFSSELGKHPTVDGVFVTWGARSVRLWPGPRQPRQATAVCAMAPGR